jgi:tRNA(Ile)-lysidine synthase
MAAFPHLKEGTPQWALVQFFKNHPPLKPLIAAISGGSDSMALYYCLQWMKRYTPLQVIVAHVNHGVRPQSAQEEAHLQELAKTNGDLFVVKRLVPVEKNFEQWARAERYTFFHELYQTHDASLCLLAHHADDVAETVIKRFFEGASFEMFKGMEPVGNYLDMNLGRPFLTLPKKALEHFPHFVDETNFTGQNLRAKMRRDLLPLLEAHFGKKIQPTVCRLAQEAQEFSSYLDSLAPPSGLTFERGPMHPFILKHFLRRWLKANHLKYSDDQVEKLKSAILSQKSGQMFFIGGKKIKVGREKVSIELV